MILLFGMIRAIVLLDVGWSCAAVAASLLRMIKCTGVNPAIRCRPAECRGTELTVRQTASPAPNPPIGLLFSMIFAITEISGGDGRRPSYLVLAMP